MLRSRHQQHRADSTSQPLRPKLVEQHGQHKNRVWVQVVIGVALLASGARLLVWSEERLLQKTLSMDEGLQSIVSIENLDVVSPSNNGKLVHVMGHLEVGEPLTEFEYGVSIPAIKLKRRVQMYQWVEEQAAKDTDEEFALTHDPLSDLNYYYYTEWKDKLIDSTNFKQSFSHENPKEFPMKTMMYVSEHVNIGGYYFGPALKEHCTDFTLVTSDERPERKDIKLHSGLYYHSRDVWNPEVGDIRVQFSYCGLAGDLTTVIAKQHNHELHPYKTKAGDEILIIKHGRPSIGNIFYEQHKQNWFLSWCIRVLCGLLIFIGCSYLTSQLKLLTSRKKQMWVFRFSTLGKILSNHSSSINLCVTASVSFGLVAYMWMSFKPAMGAFLLFSACLPITFFLYLVYVYAFIKPVAHYRHI